jgi:glyoxylase-like metal-dependent hydrolase (beta-lactamase superfamily II)
MDNLEQLYDGAYLIHCAVGGRPLHLPLLVGSNSAVLIDTGCAADCARAILPALHALQLDPARLTHVINSHCDFDHQGGNSAVMAACPAARLYCGEADRVQIESPERLIALRYGAYHRDHGIFYDDATKRAIRRELGEPQSVDGVFHGGEVLTLAADRSLEILHLPGHSCGHLGVLDRKHRTLFGGDAIHGLSSCRSTPTSGVTGRCNAALKSPRSAAKAGALSKRPSN